MAGFTSVLRFRLPSQASLFVCRGDLTRFRGDAIVNAANERMLGGGGVDGAIHAAAGPALLERCRLVPEVRPGIRCPTGEARLTSSGGRLDAKFVIHTVGPVYGEAGEAAPALLRSAYDACLSLARLPRPAESEGSGSAAEPRLTPSPLKSLAFPAISCGVFGYPIPAAAGIAVDAVLEGAGELEEVWFVLFNSDCWEAWAAAAQARLGDAAKE